ncbi:hypothetical protein J6590_090535 [Homalodisca vitripennis]|nr:hypothetical protein J6590_090535 [Homalodisca vitripennis]
MSLTVSIVHWLKRFTPSRTDSYWGRIIRTIVESSSDAKCRERRPIHYSRRHERVQLAVTNKMDRPARRCRKTLQLPPGT